MDIAIIIYEIINDYHGSEDGDIDEEVFQEAVATFAMVAVNMDAQDDAGNCGMTA